MTRFRPVSVDSRDCRYPLCPEETELDSAWCRYHQGQEQLEQAAARPATPGDPRVAAAIGLAPTGRDARSSALTLDNLERLHKLYRSGWSMGELADAIWHQAGFKNAESCRERIRQQFRALGLPVRTRGEAAAIARQRGRRAA